MEQIYYTQCPLGYGLGASNGFQVKRLSAGYAFSGDVRHLGLRALIGNSRTLAPAVLRYRMGEGGLADVAFLTPRSHEYETERGLWGRPGGHFAHGLRLDRSEMAQLQNWPAGLYQRAFWLRSDPVPTLGKAPVLLGEASDLDRLEPSYTLAAALAARVDRDLLAKLLTALASVSRDGRTLTLIDRPERLADHVLLLTLALPELNRAALTFSTYHDRPEELTGFRIQGTIPDPRLNRPTLRTLGFLADLTNGTIEPPAAPARWAETLAGWLQDRTEFSQAAWEATNRRASAEPDGTPRPDAWLDHLYNLPALLRRPILTPTESPGWSELADLAEWAREANLGPDLLEARPADWWRPAARNNETGLAALVGHLRLAGVRAGKLGWGPAVAAWLDLCPRNERNGWLGAILAAVADEARPVFLRTLVESGSAESARDTLRWLKGRPGLDPLSLLPLEVRAVSGRRVWADLLGRALVASNVLNAVLEALVQETRARPASRREAALALGDVIGTANGKVARALLRWTLSEGRGGDGWLDPFLEAIAAGPGAIDSLAEVHAALEPPLRGAFVKVLLRLASKPNIAAEVFRWGVESLLLPIAGVDRPDDPAWPGLYLDRTPSGLDLMRRLFTREYREIGVKDWLDQAKSQGRLSAEHLDRIDACARFARILRSGDARALLRVDLPTIPPADRGEMLAQIVAHVGSDSAEAFEIALDSCRAAWPGGLRPGAEGLAGIGAVLADRLAPVALDPIAWLERLEALLKRLGLVGPSGVNFEPNSLGAEVLAATTPRFEERSARWRLRAFLLRHDRAWPLLAADVREEIRGASVAEGLDALGDWDRDLVKGVHASRFFEVWLNVCDAPLLAASVSARAADLKTLPVLSWWRSGQEPGARDDIREAFARLAPIAPLAEETFTTVQNWMREPTARSTALSGCNVLADDDLVALDEDVAVAAPVAQAPMLSEFARSRWRCLEALTRFSRSGLGSDGCWQVLDGITRELALDAIAEDERYAFLAWLILRLEGAEARQLATLARWLVQSGMTDADRLAFWAEEIGERREVSVALKLARTQIISDLRAAWKQTFRTAGDEAGKRFGGR